MKKIILERLESGDQGTFGHLLGDEFILHSGELPWRDNQSNISCIPVGIYLCEWTFSKHFNRYLYEIRNVPHRTGVRIHSANLCGDSEMGYKKQVLGCITLGEKLGWLDGQKAILLSSPAIRKFESYLNHNPFILEIKYAP